MNFQNYVEVFKERENLSYEDIARMLSLRGYSVTKQAVNSWVVKGRQPDISSAESRAALCKVFKISEQVLLEYLGYNLSPDKLTSEARYAADIVNKLNEKDRRLAIRILENIAEGEGVG